MITAVQATNLAVDDKDLPPEFLQEDSTGGGKLRDDEKQDNKTDKEPPQQERMKERYTSAIQWLEGYY